MSTTTTTRFAQASSFSLRLYLMACTLTLVCLGSGCGMFRAQFGLGYGLGADVEIPGIVHTGLGVGSFYTVGTVYNLGYVEREETLISVLAWHHCGIDDGRGFPGLVDHACWCWLPPLTQYRHRGGELSRHARGWSFEFGAMCLFFNFRLGINPFF